MPARASSTKVLNLWFSDLEPFSFHFQPQGLHGDFADGGENGREVVSRTGCLCLLSIESVHQLLCPLTRRKSGLESAPELHYSC